MRTLWTFVIAAMIAGYTLLGWCSGLRADLLLLKSGGQVEGKIVRSPRVSDSEADDSYIVRLAPGALIRVAANDVGRVVKSSPSERRYAEQLSKMSDTVEAHAHLAQWCHENQLRQARDFHWQQVLRLDADHAEARRALGFRQIRGKWIRPDDFMRSQGYVEFRGKWMLPQQLENDRRAEDVKQAEGAWRRQLRMWRGWFGKRQEDEALQRFAEVNDPHAITALRELWEKETSPDVRQIYIQTLAQIDSRRATQVLLEVVLKDENEELRLLCLELLEPRDHAYMAGALLPALSSSDNEVIRRAGLGLARFGNEEAIRPLIRALITQHKTVVRPASNVQPVFTRGADGSSGFNGLQAGNAPRVIVRDVQNRTVLDALITITGQKLGFAPSAWQDWYVRQNSLPADVNLRRQ